MQNTIHPIRSTPIEWGYFNQRGSLACQKSIAIGLNTSASNSLGKKKKLWRKRAAVGLQWKALLKDDLTLNWLFLCAGKREEVWGADRGEVRCGGRAASQQLTCCRLTRRERDRGQAIISMAGWEQETDRLHTHVRQREQRSNVEIVHTQNQPQKRCAHTHRQQVISQANGSQGWGGCCPEINQAAADPPIVIFTERGRVKETGKQFNPGEDWFKPINVSATALEPTVNIHY